VKVAVCDYGAGNVRSVLAAFARLGAEVSVADTPAEVAAADLAVLPGVGSAASAMGVLCERGLDEALRARVAGGGATLGICLGLQLALEQSDEDGGVQGITSRTRTSPRLLRRQRHPRESSPRRGSPALSASSSIRRRAELRARAS
jgi:imidazoleglycerol phosphate synthase glutamine amidotransferase subunit HisH